MQKEKETVVYLWSMQYNVYYCKVFPFDVSVFMILCYELLNVSVGREHVLVFWNNNLDFETYLKEERRKRKEKH